jgi:hypothetical protein
MVSNTDSNYAEVGKEDISINQSGDSRSRYEAEHRPSSSNAHQLLSSSSSHYCVSNRTGDQVIIPMEFICPITLELMHYPMLSRHGHTYERYAILEWIAGGNGSCPITRIPLSYSDLITHRSLSYRIKIWCLQNNVEFHPANENDSVMSSSSSIVSGIPAAVSCHPTGNTGGRDSHSSYTAYPSPDSLLDFVSVMNVSSASASSSSSSSSLSSSDATNYRYIDSVISTTTTTHLRSRRFLCVGNGEASNSPSSLTSPSPSVLSMMFKTITRTNGSRSNGTATTTTTAAAAAAAAGIPSSTPRVSNLTLNQLQQEHQHQHQHQQYQNQLLASVLLEAENVWNALETKMKGTNETPQNLRLEF